MINRHTMFFLRKKCFNFFGLSLLWIAFILFFTVLLFLFGFLFKEGSGVFSLSFLLDNPKNAMMEGGIYPAIVGTILSTLLASLLACPLGLLIGVYLSEYSDRRGFLYSIMKGIISNLMAIPSIVYGLFGLALFVYFLHLGRSLLSSGLILGFLVLPYIIILVEEALQSIPISIRECSISLGANKIYTIIKILIPYAFPRILTAFILGISRAAGETAPILLTGVVYSLSHPSYAFNQPFMSLPFHIYVLSTQYPNLEAVKPIIFGSVLVLLLFIFFLNLIAVVIQSSLESRRS